MAHHMLRVLALAGTIVALATGHAVATTDLGQFCFVFVGFPDTIQLSATVPTGPEPIVDLHFRWRGANYQILGSGTATPNPSDASKIDIGLVGTHNTAVFGGNPQCSLYATLNGTTGVGPVNVTCTGSGGAPFTAAGNLTPTACN